MEGSKEIPEDQLDQMAEKEIKESKSGEEYICWPTQNYSSTIPQREKTSNQQNFLPFQDYSNALKSVVPIEQKLSIRFPN